MFILRSELTGAVIRLLLKIKDGVISARKPITELTLHAVKHIIKRKKGRADTDGQ